MFLHQSLLRHPHSSSKLKIFQLQILKVLKHKNIKSPKKVIFGSGKIIVDLLSDDGIKNIDSGTEIVSLEFLYPFPIKEIKEILNGAELKEILWVQEEPRNRGAWKYFNENIIEIHENKLKVNYVGRKLAKRKHGSYQFINSTKKL